jgi:hypothetical protein
MGVMPDIITDEADANPTHYDVLPMARPVRLLGLAFQSCLISISLLFAFEYFGFVILGSAHAFRLASCVDSNPTFSLGEVAVEGEAGGMRSPFDHSIDGFHDATCSRFGWPSAPETVDKQMEIDSKIVRSTANQTSTYYESHGHLTSLSPIVIQGSRYCGEKQTGNSVCCVCGGGLRTIYGLHLISEPPPLPAFFGIFCVVPFLVAFFGIFCVVPFLVVAALLSLSTAKLDRRRPARSRIGLLYAHFFGIAGSRYAWKALVVQTIGVCLQSTKPKTPRGGDNGENRRLALCAHWRPLDFKNGPK